MKCITLVLYWYFMDKRSLSKTKDTNLSISWGWSFCATCPSHCKGKLSRFIKVLNQSHRDTQSPLVWFSWNHSRTFFRFFTERFLIYLNNCSYSPEVFIRNIYFIFLVAGCLFFRQNALIRSFTTVLFSRALHLAT